MQESKREEIALFRYGIIVPFLGTDELEWGVKGEMLRRIAAQDYDIPHSGKHTVDEETVRKWLAAYRKGGFDSLKPRSRQDQGKPRKIPPEAWEKACALRKEAPSRSVRKVIQIMEAHSMVKHGQIKPSTLTRHFKETGLDRKNLGKDEQVFRRFEAERPNQIWQSDIMYGPYLPNPNDPARKKRTYLVAFIDDFSRLVPDAEFYWDEKFPALENTFKKAMLRRGIPELIYVDNGKVYSARRLDAACASLGVRKINCKPYQPQGKGKIERFFRTVRENFLAEPEVTQTETLPELNRLFRAWLEVDYHGRPHAATKEPPLARWRDNIANFLRTPDPKELVELFLWQVTRKVSGIGLISVSGIEFEVDGVLKGRKVEVRYNPFELDWVHIYYKDHFYSKAKPAKVTRWNTASRKTNTANETPREQSTTGIKPLKDLAEQHHKQKQQKARELTGSQSSIAQQQIITLPRFIKLVAETLDKKPEQLHPKEIETLKTFLGQHPRLDIPCATVAMAKARLRFGTKQHINYYLEVIETSSLTQLQNKEK